MQTATLDPASPAPGGAWRWWESRRLRYNLGLAAAGWIAWGLFALEVVLIQPRVGGEPFTVTLSLTLAQGLAFLIIMAVANVCFLIGPVSETVLRPDDRDAYRRRMFGLGFWFSVALPFVFPALMLVNLLSRAGL